MFLRWLEARGDMGRGNAIEREVSDEAIRQYLDGIGTYNLLTAEDEVALAKAIENGRKAEIALENEHDPAKRRKLHEMVHAGEEARQTFIRCNLRLVVSIAKRYGHAKLPFLDLVQEGNLGLIRAVEKFEYRKGFKFSTYATWWIRQAITRAIADKSRTIRVPVHMMDTITQMQSAESNLIKRLGRKPTDAELAEESGLTVEKLIEARKVAPEPVSIFEPVGEDNAMLGDFIEDLEATAPFESDRIQAQHREPALCPGPPHRAGADHHRDALRARRPRAGHPRRGGSPLQRHPRAHPPDRSQGAGQDAPSRRHPEGSGNWQFPEPALRLISPTPEAPAGRPRQVASSRLCRGLPALSSGGRAGHPRR